MAITTYAELQTAVLNWLVRSGEADAALRCVEWITLAEDELKAALATMPLRQGETNDTAYSISTQYQVLPTGFLRSRSIMLQGTSGGIIEYVAPEALDRTTLSTTVGKPTAYTVQGNQFRFIPAPDATYTATNTYQALPVLSSGNTTNWLLTAHPKIYLMATLAEAAAYYRDSDGMAAAESKWRSLFSSAFAADGPSATGGASRVRVDGGTP